MKTFTALAALVLATSVVGTANAAKHIHHHHHAMHAVNAGKASTTDWPGNPYMDMTQGQVQRFWRDAFDPFDAK
jgi:hypothetical protein